MVNLNGESKKKKSLCFVRQETWVLSECMTDSSPCPFLCIYVERLSVDVFNKQGALLSMLKMSSFDVHYVLSHFKPVKLVFNTFLKPTSHCN